METENFPLDAPLPVEGDAAAEDEDRLPLVTSITTFPAAATGLQQLRRVRRTRTQYERLQRPSDIEPGQPTSSIEGWVLLYTNLPPTTSTADIQDMMVAFKAGDSDYFGPIRSVKIPLDMQCLCLGYALVEVESYEGFKRACEELDGATIPFGAEDKVPARTLAVSPAFLAEEDDEEAEVAGPGDKRARN